MIHKTELKGKHVTYIDAHEKTRTEKVIRILGNYITVQHRKKINGKLYKFPRHRIYKDRVLGCQRKNKLEMICWEKKKKM